MSESGPTRQPLIYGISGAFTGLTIIVVALRITSRVLNKSTFWWDDWLLWFGSTLAIVINAETIYGARLGLGKHGSEVPEENVTKYFKILLSIMTIYQWSMSAIKASLLVFYYRLFSVNKLLRWTVYFGLCFIMCWHISYFFTLLFQCTPVKFFWDRTIPGGHCLDDGKVNNNAVSVSNAAFNVFTDFICLVAPLPVLWTLKLSRLKKTCLAIVFCLGGCDIVISCIRLAYLVDGQTADVTWSNTMPALWTVLELNIAAICASLPGLMPIISRVILQKRDSYQGPLGGNDIYKGATKTGISTRAFHDGRRAMSADESAMLERDIHIRTKASRSSEEDELENGCFELKHKHSQGSLGNESLDPRNQQAPRTAGGILVTSNVEQKVERQWASD